MELIKEIVGYVTLGIGALGLLVLGARRLFSGGIKLPTFNLGGGGAAPDENTLDFQALERLQHRFENAKCKEGMDACTVCLTHFFHGQTGQP